MAILLATTMLVLGGCASPGGHLDRSAPSTGRGELAYVLRIHTGSRPCAVLGAAGSVWVADLGDTRVSRINPATGRITARVRTGSQPCGMAYGAGSVWVEDYGGDSVTRIDVRSLRTRGYPAGAQPFDVTFAAGAAWVTNYGDNTVTRIDAATGQARTLAVGVGPEGIARAAGAVWVANNGSGTVSRIDTRSLRVTTIRIGGSPAWTAHAGRTVWVGDQGQGEIVRIDARTGTVVARVRVGPTPNDGGVLGGAVWFPDKSGTLYRISRNGNRVTGPFPLAAGDPFTLVGYAGRLWIADFAGTDVLVVNPARLP